MENHNLVNQGSGLFPSRNGNIRSGWHIDGKVDEANSGEENEILTEDREKFGLTLTDSKLEKDADVVDITLCTAASKMKQP